MYKIKEFSAMTGLPQSKIRFYEKHGLILSNREENGYRIFTPEDAFRANSFRILLQYGFSVDEAVQMIDANQNTEHFKQSLSDQREKLAREADIITYRLSRIDSALDSINSDLKSEFTLVNMPNQLYINASIGSDFSISIKNKKIISEFYSLLSITSCSRIIKKEELTRNSPTVNPDYIISISANEEFRLSKHARNQVSVLNLGECIRFRRQVTRRDSVKKKTFNELFHYLQSYGYTIRDNIILFPSFLNLNEQGSDIEILYVPIQ